MATLFSLILTLAIVTGQIVKIPIGGGGATLLDIAVLTFCLIGIIQIKLRLLKPPFYITAGLIFSLVALISLIFTSLKLTPSQYLSSSLYIVRFFSVIFLGWLLFSKALGQVKNNINKILLLSGVSFAILGLLQFIFLPDLHFLSILGWDPHYYRNASTFLDPNFAGAFFVLTLLLLLQNLKGSKKMAMYSILVYLSLLTTFSRSSYLMFLISFLTLAVLKKSIKLSLLTIALFALLIFSFQFQTMKINNVIRQDRNETASLRFSTWQQGLEIFQKNPILGVGYNAYIFALRQYNLGDEQFLTSKGATTNDSSLLYILSTTGILGIITYFIFILGIFKTKNFTLIAGFTGLLVHSIFVNSLFYPFILVWVILSLSYSYAKPSA